MRTLADALVPERIIWFETRQRDAALHELLELVVSSPSVHDRSALQRAIFDRDVLMNSGADYGVAIPHARIPSVDDFVLSLGISHEGIAYGGGAPKPVRLVVMIAGPSEDHGRYLQLLSALLKFVKSEKGHILASRSAASIVEMARAYPLVTRHGSARAASGSRF